MAKVGGVKSMMDHDRAIIFLPMGVEGSNVWRVHVLNTRKECRIIRKPSIIDCDEEQKRASARKNSRGRYFMMRMYEW